MIRLSTHLASRSAGLVAQCWPISSLSKTAVAARTCWPRTTAVRVGGSTSVVAPDIGQVAAAKTQKEKEQKALKEARKTECFPSPV